MRILVDRNQQDVLEFRFRYLLVTDLVPSEIACLESSPGRMRRTDVWISRDEMVDFLEYEASSAIAMSHTISDQTKTNSLDASVAIRSKISLTKLLRMAIALLEIPVSGWTCLRTKLHMSHYPRNIWMKSLTFVDIWRVSLLSDLLTLLLVVTVSCGWDLWSLLRRLRGLCRFRRGLGSSGGGSLSSSRCGFRCHKLTIYGSERTIRWW